MSHLAITPTTEQGFINMAAATSRAGPTALKENDRDTLQMALDVADQFLKLNKHLPLQAYACFLYAAIHQDDDAEGVGPVEMAKKRGVSPTVFSRYMLDMGDRGRDMGPGLGLVTTEAVPHNRRHHPVRLTTKGLHLVQNIIERFRMASRFAKGSH